MPTTKFDAATLRSTVPVLIVEDDPDFGASLRMMLEAEGFDAALAANEVDAIELVKSHRAEIALVDVRLGNASGTQLIATLEKAKPGLLSISMTAYASVESVTAALERGAYAFLRKPFHHDELLSTLDNCLEHVRLERAKCEAENALRASETRYRILVEGSALGIAIQRDGRLEFVNDTLTRMYGYSATGALIGQPVEVLQLSEVTPETRSQQITRLDRTTATIEYTSDAITWDSQSARVISVMDITKRVEAEQSRRELEVQLHQVQRLEALGTLAGGIAHDFNNVLAAILGYSELTLAELPPGSASRHKIEQIVAAGLRAKELVQQILAFGQRRGRVHDAIHVAPIIREVIALVQATLPSTIQVTEDLSTTNDGVRADPTELHQVLVNLCTNAGHAMREGGGQLEIKLDRVTADESLIRRNPELRPGTYVRVTVRDTGTGMGPDVASRAFDPFFTTKRVGTGSGMGLAVVHGIVAHSNGAIAMDSKDGEGTTISVYLPAVDCVVLGPVADEKPAPVGVETILLVDDESMLTELGQMSLERLGYSVVSFEDSRRALEAFEATPDVFDLLMTDQTMPRLTGLELTKRVRLVRPDLPVVLCTGFSGAITEEEAKAEGVSAFLRKPYDVHELSSTVRRVLDQQPEPE